MGGNARASGPDFSTGIGIETLPDAATIAGHVGEDAVLLSRFGGEYFAVGGTCTHYGAALSSGLCAGDTVRCPWHHACFSLKTGAALRAPALDDLDAWQVEVEGDTLFVRKRQEHPASPTPTHRSDARSIVIVGAGAAGLACAHELRRLGYSGALTMLSADADPPVDRPNLSKDYLAGTAEEAWMPLRPGDWYEENRIDLRLGCEIERIDSASRRVHSVSGEQFAYDRLLIATGSEPNRLQGPGFERDNVFTLRSFADARAIAARARSGMRAAVIGSSFIGLEAAAALRHRGLEVDIVSPEPVPFEGVFGEEVGRFLQHLHERNGVRFHLGTVADSFDGRALSLANGQRLEADLVLVGIGVRPRLEIAQSAGLADKGGIAVDTFLRTEVPDVYAAGDIAAAPNPRTGEPQRIEHWVVAERQGQIAAANMLGLGRRYDMVPFFWTEQFGVLLRYVGHAAKWDKVDIDGDVAGGDFIARYSSQSSHLASAGVGRDLEILEDERRMEERIAEAVERDPGAREPHPAAAVK